MSMCVRSIDRSNQMAYNITRSRRFPLLSSFLLPHLLSPVPSPPPLAASLLICCALLIPSGSPALLILLEIPLASSANVRVREGITGPPPPPPSLPAAEGEATLRGKGGTGGAFPPPVRDEVVEVTLLLLPERVRRKGAIVAWVGVLGDWGMGC